MCPLTTVALPQDPEVQHRIHRFSQRRTLRLGLGLRVWVGRYRSPLEPRSRTPETMQGHRTIWLRPFPASGNTKAVVGIQHVMKTREPRDKSRSVRVPVHFTKVTFSCIRTQHLWLSEPPEEHSRFPSSAWRAANFKLEVSKCSHRYWIIPAATGGPWSFWSRFNALHSYMNQKSRGAYH